ncbi:hypothetical protein GF318_00450 [Candidatus Micrarchaeota archaeon]|nr:hypothetical protein [Candidatus Micrarchaeota archaeon]
MLRSAKSSGSTGKRVRNFPAAAVLTAGILLCPSAAHYADRRMCTPEITSTRLAKSVKDMAKGRVKEKEKKIRELLNADKEQSIIVRITLEVEKTGELKVREGIALCDGGPCKGDSDFIEKIGLDLSGMKIAAPEKPCSWDIRVSLLGKTDI